MSHSHTSRRPFSINHLDEHVQHGRIGQYMQILSPGDRCIVGRCRVTSLLTLRIYRAYHVPGSAIGASEAVTTGGHPQFIQSGMPVLMCWTVLLDMRSMKRPIRPIEFSIIGRVVMFLVCSGGLVESLTSLKVRTATVSQIRILKI